MNLKGLMAGARSAGHWWLHVPWTRLFVGFAMVAEGISLHFGTNPLTAQIGDNEAWQAALILGGWSVWLTLFMSPGHARALVAAVPIFVQVARSLATYYQLDVPIFSGGVLVRLSLAAMMISSFGWSADVAARARETSRDLA